MRTLSGLNNNSFLSSDAQIIEALESLMRGAAIKTVQEAKQNLDGLAMCNNQSRLDNQIYNNALQGLDDGTLEPLTKSEFLAALRYELSPDQLEGWWSDLKDSARRVGKEVRKGVKTAGNIIKRVTLAPIELNRRLFKAIKKGAKKLLPLIKKVAPYAAVAALAFYGGPYAWAAIKKYGPQAIAYAKSMLAGKKSATAGQQPAQATSTNLMMMSAQNPEIVDTTARAIGADLAANGVNIESQGGWDMLKGLARAELSKVSRQIVPDIKRAMMGPPPPPGYGPTMGPPPPPGYGPTMGPPPPPGYAPQQKSVLPMLAIGAAALLAFK